MSALATGRAAAVWRYLAGLGITVVCTAVAYPLYRYFDPVNIAMVYLLGATLAGLRLGRGPSALTAVANTVAFDYFFVPPRFSFYVAETQYLFTLGVMLGVAVVIANLMAGVRSRNESLAERERRTAILYAMSRELAAAPDAVSIAQVAARHIGSAFETAAAVLLPDERGVLAVWGMSERVAPAADPKVARRVFEQQNKATPQSDRADRLYLPLAAGDRARGVLIVDSLDQTRSLPERQVLLEALSGQTALALERVRLADLAAEARAAADRTALRNTLLASISHDLRGPLAAIASAGSLVAQSSDSLDRHRRKTLGSLIEEKARDMSGLLSNVLELIRLENTAGPPRADWESLLDLVGTAVRNNEHCLDDRRVMSVIPTDFPLLRMDAQLIVQLLSNLLENASRHTPPGTLIQLRATLRGTDAILTVEDNGPGFGARNPETLFEKFERGQQESSVSGVGLGLAICRAVARLHGGDIHAANRPGGGARFEITLPMDLAARPADSVAVAT